MAENYATVPSWVVLNAAADAGTLAVGDNLPVSITFSPGSGAAEGFYTFYLRVTADNYPTTDIPMHLSVTPDGIGSALFKVTDIYTGTFNDYNELIQGLSNARITVQNEKNLTIVHEQRTDALGEALFANLSAGIYKYRIQAAGHQEKIGRLWIKPGLTTSEDVFLESNLVTVQWQVVETTIQDKYDIVLTITYETDVPAPVVVCEPASVALPDLKAGDVLNGEFTLTNHGLIRADNLEVHLPADDNYVHYQLLAPVPLSLGAKERIVIPYRLTCVQSLSPTEQTQSGGGSGCYRSCFSTSYSGVNVNGCPFSDSVPHCFYRTCSGSPGTGGGGGGWGYWYGGGSGSSYGGYGGAGGVATDIPGQGAPCTPAPGNDSDNSRCTSGSGGSGGRCDKDSKQPVCQKTGSWVNLFMRSFVDEATDLSVKVPGGSIDLYRAFYTQGYAVN